MQKARAAQEKWTGAPAFILAADTVVALGRRILPKAENEAQVRACLKLLSGRRHQVMTAVALIAPSDSKEGGKLRTRIALTRVSMLRLTDAQIARYVESREGEGKADAECYAPAKSVCEGAETYHERVAFMFLALSWRESVRSVF